MSDSVQLQVSEGVALITLNEPEHRNALSIPLMDALEEILKGLITNMDARVVVLTGAGKGFCAGADFGAMAEITQRTGLTGPAATLEAIKQLYARLRIFDALPQPTIAAINGAAVGGGLGLALLCDLRVAAEDAKIGANFSRLGIHPGLGISHLLPRLIGYQAAAEMLFTGELISGSRAAEIGLVREAVPANEVLPRAMALATKIAANAPLSLRSIKRTLRAGLNHGLQETMELEAVAQAFLALTDDAREGVMARMERRDPRFSGK